jgi:hypothetical protein
MQELIVAIALWCSSHPVTSTWGVNRQDTVQQCRDKLLKCFEDDKSWIKGGESLACFEKSKL